MAEHNETGKQGETIAADYLIQKGYIIIARNWRFRHKEVDMIARIGKYIVIIEVKTRSSLKWQHPRESITPSKIRFLTDAAEQFVQQRRIDCEIRFDTVSVVLKSSSEWDVEHIEGAFTATMY